MRAVATALLAASLGLANPAVAEEPVVGIGYAGKTCGAAIFEDPLAQRRGTRGSRGFFVVFDAAWWADSAVSVTVTCEVYDVTGPAPYPLARVTATTPGTTGTLLDFAGWGGVSGPESWELCTSVSWLRPDGTRVEWLAVAPVLACVPIAPAVPATAPPAVTR